MDQRKKTFTQIPNLQAKRKTVSVDYYPIHQITCPKYSVLEDCLVAVACTEHMLVIYELTEGRAILRVRKHYDGAYISIGGIHLIAYEGGQVDIFQLYLDLPGIRHLKSIDAHSGQIVDLEILGDGMYQNLYYISRANKKNGGFSDKTELCGTLVSLSSLYIYNILDPGMPYLKSIAKYKPHRLNVGTNFTVILAVIKR